ncbi:hypothetical protein DWZ40_02750 [Clostridium sp. AF32-12BH]|nr:hypothetical protein DWZ40_02750 [Clostridium sp. AF32-12BH]
MFLPSFLLSHVTEVTFSCDKLESQILQGFAGMSQKLGVILTPTSHLTAVTTTRIGAQARIVAKEKPGKVLTEQGTTLR